MGERKAPTPPPADRFHEHLDTCERCRTQPFNLCPTGADLLLGTVKPEPPPAPPAKRPDQVLVLAEPTFGEQQAADVADRWLARAQAPPVLSVDFGDGKGPQPWAADMFKDVPKDTPIRIDSRPWPVAPVYVGVDWGKGDDHTVLGARARRRQRRAAEQLLNDIRAAEDQAMITGRPAPIGDSPMVAAPPEPKLHQLRRGTWWALVNGPDDLPVLFDGYRVAVESADPDEYPVAVVVMERAEWETAQRQHRAIYLLMAAAILLAAVL